MSMYVVYVSEDEVMEQLFKCFCVDMKSPEVKQTAVKTVADVYSTVSSSKSSMPYLNMMLNRVGARTQLCFTLLTMVSREVAVQPNLAALVFVQLDNDTEELWG